MTTRGTIFVLQLAALSVVSLDASSDVLAQNPEDRVYPPRSVVEGRTVREWMVEHNKWAVETPPDRNPNFNHEVECSSSQNQPVFFLPWMESGETRSCTLSEDVPVFVPLLHGTEAFPGVATPDQCAIFIARIADGLDRVTELYLEIDGEELSRETLFGHREQTEECYEITLPDPNIVGLRPGLWTAATGGYVLVVRPLSPGPHTIHTRFTQTRPDNESRFVSKTWDLEVGPTFLRGDSNDDGNVDLSDAVAILDFLFLGGGGPGCGKAADTNDSGGVDLSDAVTVLNYLFLGGTRPPDPFSACGVDPSEDDLTCEAYSHCE